MKKQYADLNPCYAIIIILAPGWVSLHLLLACVSLNHGLHAIDRLRGNFTTVWTVFPHM
jgi:hypothetical protein